MPTINKTPRKNEQRRKPHSGRKNNGGEKFNYNQTAWRRKSKANLRDNPFCVECRKVDRWTVATVSDHIDPINQGGAIWDNDNIQSLCAKCHNQKSGREAHQRKIYE